MSTSHQGAPRTILVVDDDRDVQRFLAERLEREGWRVIGEKDGDWALRSFERRRVDAVVLDILIPVVNGFQVAERIRATPHGRDVGIVMLTGIYRGAKHRAEAIEKYGLIDYLDKPVDVDRLVELLRVHFETRAPAALSDKHPAQASSPKMLAAGTVEAAGMIDQARGRASERGGGRDATIDEAQKQERRDVERAARAVDKPADADQLRGNLKRMTFPRLLTKLYKMKATGGLFLLRDKVKKIVYFTGGQATFIKSNMLDECLGRVLVRERMITEQECEESVRRMKAHKRQQGSVLIEMGIISPHNLRFGLELQLQVKLFDVFDWAEGEYVFRSDVPLPDDVIGLDLSTAQIVLEGIRRAYHYERLEAALGSIITQYLEPAEDPVMRYQDLDLSPAEQQFVEAIDGTRTVGEALREAPKPLDRHGAMALLHALHSAGILSVRETAAKRGRTASYGLPGSDGIADDISDAQLAEWVAARRGADAFAVLGLSQSASAEEIERAYAAHARDLHPDRFRGRPETTLALAREAFDLLGAAFRDLGDPKRKKQLEKARAAGKDVGLASVDVPLDDITRPDSQTQDPASRALAADKLFGKGGERLRARDFAEAERLYRQATQLRDDVGLYHAYLGWAIFNARGQGPTAAKEALPSLERALALAPSEEHPHLFLGMVHAAMGRPELAEPEFEKAMQSNPDSAEALRELRLLHMRRQRR